MDLKFKIIAEHVQAGWDRATGSLSALKAKFADFFGGVKGGFGMMAGAIVTAVAGIAKAFEAIRQKWVSEIGEMSAASREFAEVTRDNFRKIRFQDTEIEKARNIDNIKDQLSRRRQRLEDLELDDATESLAGSGMDWVSGKWRAAKGLGDADKDKAERTRLAQEIYTLERQLALASKMETKDKANAEKEAAEEAKKSAKERRDADKARHDSEMAWKAEEEAAAAKIADAERAAFEAAAQQAEALAAKKARQKELVEGVSTARREAAYAAASPAERVAMDRARLSQLGQQFNARDGLGQFVATDEQRAGMATEAIGIKSRIDAAAQEARATIEAEAQAKDQARRAAAGQSLGVGDLFTRMYGQGIERSPEQETADNTKKALEVLRAIEKKTGAAP